MKLTSSLVCISLVVSLIACSSPESMNKQLLGTWMIERVYEGENDVTAQHNPSGNRWIKFNRNGSFESGGDPYGHNDGNWELDTTKSILFLDSNTEDDDSEWNVSFQDNKVIWQGIGTPRQESFKIISIREE